MKANEGKSHDSCLSRRKIALFTGAFITGGLSGEKISCVYCNGDHLSLSCQKIENPQARNDIFKEQEGCFLYARQGRRVNQ